MATGSIYRIAGTPRYGNYQSAQDGTLATAVVSNTDPPVVTTINIGQTFNGALQFFGYIRRVAVWNGIAFTDDQLTWATS